jgi:hypothetical protein
MKSSKECALSFNPTSLKVRFNGDNNIDNTYYSQAMQDLFVLGCLNGKKEGTYLELGCDEPFNINNTWLLEDKFNWKGISVDINPQSKQLFDSSGRTSTVLIQDATTLNFNNITNLLSTTHIDYLSLDLEPASITLKCLESIPFDEVSFSVITFEHDAYRFGDQARTPSREILENRGYVRLVDNVDRFEDWYINTAHVDMDLVSAYRHNNISYVSASTVLLH